MFVTMITRAASDSATSTFLFHFADNSIFLSTTQIISVDYKWLITFHAYYSEQNIITTFTLSSIPLIILKNYAKIPIGRYQL
jgi:hypothetical protein